MWIRDNQQGISKSVFKERYPFLADHLLDRSLKSLAKEQGLFLFPTSWQEIPDLDKSEKLFETVDHSLRTGNVIGFIGYQNDQLTIHSRFAQSDKGDYFLHYMLQKVLHLNVTNLETSFSLEQQFYQLFICLFPSVLQAALRKGLYKEYRRFHHHDANLKGALDIARQLKTSTPFEGKMAYSTREFSFDNNLMQLVRHTIEYIKGHQLSRTSLLFQDKDRENIETIIQATPRYQLADRTKIIYQNQVAPVRHAYYHEYGTLQKLCLLILKGTRHGVGERQQQKIQGILFDVAWLWEEYLAQLLGEEFHHPRNKAKSDSFSMFQGGNGRIYPDFVSLSKKVVADAKYKPIDNIKGRDYLQLVAYMYRFDARKGFYLFPHSGKTEESKQYELLEGKCQRRNEPVVVEKLGLAIPQGVASFDEFCQQIERNEQVFLQSLLSKSRGEISEVMGAK